jgi:hypothetical protein
MQQAVLFVQLKLAKLQGVPQVWQLASAFFWRKTSVKVLLLYLVAAHHFVFFF